MNAQPSAQRGQLINVPVLEQPGQTRIGRFGHKDQQASLLSFSADAYVNEMGITSPMQPDENTSNGSGGRASRRPFRAWTTKAWTSRCSRCSCARPRRRRWTRRIAASAGRAGRGSEHLQQHRLRRVPHPAHRHRAPGDPHQRRRAPGRQRAGQQDHPPVQRLRCCTTWAPATASCRTAAPRRATRSGPRPLWGLRARGRFMHDNAQLQLRRRDRSPRQPGRLGARPVQRPGSTDKSRLLRFLSSL